MKSGFTLLPTLLLVISAAVIVGGLILFSGQTAIRDTTLLIQSYQANACLNTCIEEALLQINIGGSGGPASIGPQDPTAVVSDPTNPAVALILPWSNPTNAMTNNGVNASLSSMGGGSTKYLRASGYNLNISQSATINGIEVTVKRSATGFVSDFSAKLYDATGTPAGADRVKSGNWPSTGTSVIYGSPTDLWGLTLTPTIVNSVNFGFGLSANLGASSGALVDWMAMKVYFTTPSGLSGSLNCSPGNCSYDVVSLGGESKQVTVSSTVQSTIRKAKLRVASTTPKLIITEWREVADF